MSRMLGFFPLIIAIITVILVMVISFINMYLLTKHKKNYVIICVHIVSIFAVFGLIFYMMSAGVFVHPLSNYYLKLSNVFLLLSVIGILGGAVLTVIGGKKYSLKNSPPSIPVALTNIEDVVFVINPEGVITHINHPNKFYNMLGDVGHIGQLYTYLKEHSNSQVGDFENIVSPSTTICELFFDKINTYAVLKLLPIESGSIRLGYTAVLEDISAIRAIEKELLEQNEQLVQANNKLTNYIKTAGALEAEKERLQILTRVQESLIYDVEKALFSVKNLKKRCFEDGTYHIAMKELAAQLREIYQKVRNAVGEISGKEMNA